MNFHQLKSKTGAIQVNAFMHDDAEEENNSNKKQPAVEMGAEQVGAMTRGTAITIACGAQQPQQSI